MNPWRIRAHRSRESIFGEAHAWLKDDRTYATQAEAEAVATAMNQNLKTKNVNYTAEEDDGS
jgi:hypothetical protein